MEATQPARMTRSKQRALAAAPAAAETAAITEGPSVSAAPATAAAAVAAASSASDVDTAASLKGQPELCESKAPAAAAVDTDAAAVSAADEAHATSCSICFETPGKRGVLKCGHQYCFDCIMQWSKTETTCPLCKARFTSVREEDIPADAAEVAPAATKGKGKGKRKAKKQAVRNVKVPRRDQAETLAQARRSAAMVAFC